MGGSHPRKRALGKFAEEAGILSMDRLATVEMWRMTSRDLSRAVHNNANQPSVVPI